MSAKSSSCVRWIVVCVAVVVATGLGGGGGEAFGYAGEAGSGDGPDAAYAGLAVSTHHTHLTRALAYCAGFPALVDHRNPINPLVSPEDAEWAERLALHDELTDQGTITGVDADAGTCRVSYTYALLQACAAVPAGGIVCLPDVDVTTGGTCAAGGQTTGCEEGTAVMPMTPACGSRPAG